jgi:hypothetical protein
MRNPFRSPRPRRPIDELLLSEVEWSIGQDGRLVAKILKTPRPRCLFSRTRWLLRSLLHPASKNAGQGVVDIRTRRPLT